MEDQQQNQDHVMNMEVEEGGFHYEDEEEEEGDEDEEEEAQHQERGADQDFSILRDIFANINARMLLSNEERRRALAIKAAILDTEDLEPLSDMMYAQLALIDHNNVGAAVDRARHLQYLRGEYNIKDTHQAGCEVSKVFLKQHVGHILSIAFNAVEGNYVIIYDQANFDQSVLDKHRTGWATFLSYGWYLYHAMNPDLHAIRQGIILIAECEGLDWKKTDMNTMSRVWQELLVAYPVKFGELKLFHTGVVANLTFALLKKVLPERIHSRYNLGCQFDGRLDTYYRLPTPEIADQRVQAEFECFLKMRYENERVFTLE